MKGKGILSASRNREGLACCLVPKFSSLSLSNLHKARVDTLLQGRLKNILGTELKSLLSFKTSCFDFRQKLFFYHSLISTYPPHRHQTVTSSLNVASSCYAHLRFYQILTIFGSLTTFFTSEDLFAWEEKR